MFEILFLSFIVLVLITLVGHAMWLAFAVVFRAVFGEPAKRSPSASPPLKRPVPPVSDELGALETMTRKLEQFLARGSVDRETFDKVKGCIESRKLFLTGPPAAVKSASEEKKVRVVGAAAGAPAAPPKLPQF